MKSAMSETAALPIMDNELVKDFLDMMEENGRDVSGFVAMLGYVTSMESMLNMAVSELQSLRHELSVMREERDHPLRTAMRSAARSLEAGINDARERLDDLKASILIGCKNAADAFKQRGISVLNGVAVFFRLKPALESLRGKLQDNIKANQTAIAKIEAVSAEYHSAGRHVKNLFLVLRGKTPIPDIKQGGKLMKLAESPFRSELKCLKNALGDVEKAIDALDRLDRAEAERGGDKPSVRENMKTLGEKIALDKKEPSAAEKTRRKEAEI